MLQFAALEAGGTKFVCGVGSGPSDLRTIRIPAVTPEKTIPRCLDFFRQSGPLAALGVGSFGPIDRERGFITTTPKAGWRDCDLAGPFRGALNIPVAFDSDVNAAILGESRWGAARGMDNCLYLTIGTGIGGATLHTQSEMGHIRLPRVVEDESFPGICPFHGDCLEGLASGLAIAARCGQPGESLASDHPVWEIEAHYLALAIANFSYTLAPARVIIGGGVMQQTHLFPKIRSRLATLLNNYVAAPELVQPALGSLSGVLGALALAERCFDNAERCFDNMATDASGSGFSGPRSGVYRRGEDDLRSSRAEKGAQTACNDAKQE
jgi:fructokinase